MRLHVVVAYFHCCIVFQSMNLNHEFFNYSTFDGQLGLLLVFWLLQMLLLTVGLLGYRVCLQSAVIHITKLYSKLDESNFHPDKQPENSYCFICLPTNLNSAIRSLTASSKVV